MHNKKVGILLLVISIALGIVLWVFMQRVYQQSSEMGCFNNPGCLPLERSVSLSNVIVGILSFLFALGGYLIFFARGEESIVHRMEMDQQRLREEEKFELILKVLDPYESKVLRAVKEQDGITQNTLRLRTDLSKAKLSYVLQELEKRNLIKRIEKGKTLAVYIKV